MRHLAVLALFLMASACATEDQTQDPVVETIPTTSSTPTPSSTPAETATTVTEVSPPLNIAFEPGIDGAPPEGLPESFIGVTTEWSVVEIDTISGKVVRTLAEAPVFPDEEPEGPEYNRISQAWWHRESQRLVIEEGPEPAAGNIFHFPAGRPYEDIRNQCSEDLDGVSCGYGWQAALSPNGDFVFHTGYFASITENGQMAPSIEVAPTEANERGSFFYDPVFLMDRPGVAFVEEWEQGRQLQIVELSGLGQVVERVTHELEFDIASIAVRADGKLVLLEAKERFGFKGDRAEVIDPDTGETLAEFSLEPGSNSLGYDPTGTYLLYIDGDGTARWQGRGESGVLAEGLIHADW